MPRSKGREKIISNYETRWTRTGRLWKFDQSWIHFIPQKKMIRISFLNWNFSLLSIEIFTISSIFRLSQIYAIYILLRFLLEYNSVVSNNFPFYISMNYRRWIGSTSTEHDDEYSHSISITTQQNICRFSHDRYRVSRDNNSRSSSSR